MYKILAVDNDLLLLHFMQDLLEEAGHEVKTAEDGISALSVLESYIPDFMFVDLIMPNIDGKRLCRTVRKMAHLKNTRLIILSAAAKEESLDASLLGVEKIIAKRAFKEMAEDILAVLAEAKVPTPFLSDERYGVIGDASTRGITKELLYTKEHFELILERMTDGVLEITRKGKIVYANRVACRLIGLSEEELLGLDLLAFFTPRDRLFIEERLGENYRKNDVYAEEEILVLNDYLVTADVIEINGDKGKHIVILNDVTERKKMEASMIRSERLAATGQLAASIAHQINSPLQGITAILSVMKEGRADDPDLERHIQLLDGAFKSIRDTVRKLLDLNRPGQEKRQSVSIHEIVEDTVSLVGTHLQKAGIKMHVKFHKEPIYVTVSPQELEHAFLNLINNAIEAITSQKNQLPGYYRGEITIISTLEQGCAAIEISDSGPGIPEDDLDRIFDAFYTKKGNLGMGIGLAVCKSVVDKNNGTIEARNIEGSGASFIIRLPLNKRNGSN